MSALLNSSRHKLQRATELPPDDPVADRKERSSTAPPGALVDYPNRTPGRRAGRRRSEYGGGSVRAIGATQEIVTAPGIEMRTSTNDSEVIVSVTGELDLAGVPALEGVLRAASGDGSRSIVLHLAGLDFIDSSGLRAIIRIADTLAEREVSLVIRSASVAVMRLLAVTGLDGRLVIEPHAAEWRPLQPTVRPTGEVFGGRSFIRAETAREVVDSMGSNAILRIVPTQT